MASAQKRVVRVRAQLVARTLHVQQLAMVERLYSLYTAGKMSRMVISGQVDPSRPEELRAADSRALNGIVYWAWQLYPDYFIPFVNMIAANEDSIQAVWTFLRLGFKGIGEVFVHALNKEINDNTNLVEQLNNLLDELITESIECDVIIAHCGAGPDGGKLVMDSPELDAYVNGMEDLLARDNVYFDLAGMQIGGPDNDAAVNNLVADKTLTPMGKQLYGLMQHYPGRFMLGLDMDPQFEDAGGDEFSVPPTHHWGVRDFENSISYYRKFIRRLPVTSQQMILSGNATRLFG